MPRSGCFITLEGTEGVGKSSHLKFMAQRLRAAGIDVVVTREPGGTRLGEQIREWVLAQERQALSAEVETLLMFAARAQHLDEVIRPALEAGQWVVCDRFTDATYAYQGGGRGLDRVFLDQLAAAVQKGLNPDLTLLLDAPVDVGLARISDRPLDHFEREDRAFFERVRAAYLELASRHPERVKAVDADRPLADVEQEIDRHLGLLISRFVPHDDPESTQ